MSKRSEFLDRIKLIVKPKEKSKVEEEKKYDGYFTYLLLRKIFTLYC